MPAKKNAVPPRIYPLKVRLLGTSPPIWRRLLVPANMTLAQLHEVLPGRDGVGGRPHARILRWPAAHRAAQP
jgi:hypothetical protein